MLISCNEGLVAQLVLKVVSEGLDSVAHAVSRGDVREVLEEIGHNSFVYWLLEVVIFIAAVSLLLCSQLFAPVAC